MPRSRAAARRSRKPAGDLNAIREALYEVMWDDVGIVRDAASLARAAGKLDELDARLDASASSGQSRVQPDLARLAESEEPDPGQQVDPLSRRWRARIRAARISARDFPDVRDLENSRFTCVTLEDGRFDCDQAGRVHAREARARPC